MVGKNSLLKVLLAILFFVSASACGVPYGVYHTVEKGQTLYNIAKVYNVPLEDVEKANNITDTTDLRPGEKIFIPGASKTLYVPPTVKTGENSANEQTTTHKNNNNVANVNKTQEPARVEHFNNRSGISFIWPLKGKILQGFNTSNGSRHDGIDIKAPAGTPICAAANGTVIYSDDTIRGYGNMIIIKHKDGFVTVYAHNSVNLVKKNQEVKQGQIIAKVGDTGYATTPHLHFEIRLHAIPVNPLNYLH
ncbi:MAG: peptidoglycan DD-metalloendopeptidase family protein [bacterium]